jgi:hypothetical protein
MHAGGSTVGALSIDDGELGCGGGDMDGGGGCAVSGSRFVRCTAAVDGTLISVPDAAAAGGAPHLCPWRSSSGQRPISLPGAAVAPPIFVPGVAEAVGCAPPPPPSPSPV